MKATIELEFESNQDYRDFIDDVRENVDGLADYEVVDVEWDDEEEDDCYRDCDGYRVLVYEYRDCATGMGVKTDERDRLIETIKERWPDLAMRLIAKGLKAKWDSGDCSLEDYMVKANKVGCMDDELLDAGLRQVELELPANKESFHGLRIYRARIVEE